MTDKKASYTSADSVPMKLLTMYGREFMKSGISAIHPQVIPTNKCNLKCSWCSCANEDMSMQLSREHINPMADALKTYGAQAVTITGGGEPTLYPHLDELIKTLKDLGVEVGMVTNGLRLGDHNRIDKLTWCRVSVSDDRNVATLIDTLSEIIPNHSIDWAFSYVLTNKPDYEKLKRVIRFAHKYQITHIRIVSDLLDTDNVPSPPPDILNDPIVIYQDRKTPRHGSSACRMHMIKPVIAPDLKVYTCCGAQYALREPSLKMPNELCVGHLFETIDSKPFDGSICAKCYYTEYNAILETLACGTMKHTHFI